MENLDAEQAINELETQTKYAKFIGSEGVLLSVKCATFVLEHAQFYEQRIKELTEENAEVKSNWQKLKESHESACEKCRAEFKKLTEENERLRAENARYEAENHAQFDKWLKLEEATKRHHSELFEEAKIAVKEETVRKMQERLDKRFCHDPVFLGVEQRLIMGVIDQIAKEMLDNG